MQLIPALIAAGFAATLAACTIPSVHSMTDEAGHTFTMVDTGMDEAGGPRIKMVISYDQFGRPAVLGQAAGPGTFQAAAAGAVGDLALAGGAVGGAALIRPPTSNSSTVMTQGGASTGNVSATGGEARAKADPVALGLGGNATSRSSGNRTNQTMLNDQFSLQSNCSISLFGC